MRLGQLARKISIRQSDMVDFLVKSGVSIVNDSNARLEDEHVQSIIQHFAPSFLEDAIASVEPISSEATIEQPAAALTIEEEVKVEQMEISVPQTEIPQAKPQIEEKIEVIKAPKVDLPGLKVLGKIELPEPKKKEIPVPLEEAENSTATVPNIETNPKPSPTLRSRNTQDNRLDKKRERPNRSAVNPIALQREREARAAEEKRRIDAIKEKEKRTEYYLNRVKANAPTKAARIYSEQVEEFTTTAEKEPPKTWLGKFFRWLTT